MIAHDRCTHIHLIIQFLSTACVWYTHIHSQEWLTPTPVRSSSLKSYGRLHQHKQETFSLGEHTHTTSACSHCQLCNTLTHYILTSYNVMPLCATIQYSMLCMYILCIIIQKTLCLQYITAEYTVPPCNTCTLHMHNTACTTGCYRHTPCTHEQTCIRNGIQV